MSQPANAFLSKSQIVAGQLCPRRLWLMKHRPDLQPAPPAGRALRAIEDGNAVGELAQAQYPAGILVHSHARGDSLSASATRTAELLAQPGDITLFEAAFRAEQALVLVDVLERRNGELHLIEVKASTEVKDYHLDDVTAQAWVMTQAGYQPARVFLRHLSNAFIAQGDGKTDGLLVSEDVTEQITEALREMPQTLAGLRGLIAGKDPCTPIGSQCKKPFECGYRAFCRAEAGVGEFHVEDYYPRLSDATRKKLRAAGISDIRSVPDSFAGTSGKVQRIRACCQSGQPVLAPAARTFMKAQGYPRYFLDFEGIDFAIPQWAGTHSYQQVPFQWSLHVVRKPGATTEHFAHLHSTAEAPMRSVLTHLCEVMGREGPVFVYNKTYEIGVLKAGMDWCPELTAALANIEARIVDLLRVAEDNYYHPAMKASWSIKSVLPTISSLNYKDLDGVQEGTGAQNAFLELIAPNTSPQRCAQLREELLRYCGQDTEALVQLAGFFEGRP